MNIPVEVIEACASNRCVLFVGSRATSEAVVEEGGTYLEQKRLARKLGGRVSVRAALAELLQGAPRDEVIKRLRSHLAVPDTAPGDFHLRCGLGSSASICCSFCFVVRHAARCYPTHGRQEFVSSIG